MAALLMGSALRRAAEGLGPSPLRGLLPRAAADLRRAAEGTSPLRSLHPRAVADLWRAAEGPSPLRGLLPWAAADLRRVPQGPSSLRGLHPRGAPPHGPSLYGGVLPRRAQLHVALRVFSTTNAGAVPRPVSASELEKAEEEKNEELLLLLLHININISNTIDNKRKQLLDLLLRINSSSTLADFELIEEKKKELLVLLDVEAAKPLYKYSWVIERLARMHPVAIGLILMWPFILISKLTFDILDFIF